MKAHDLSVCTCICIPRAKAFDTYTDKQLFFIEAISCASSSILGAIDGSNIIQRHTDTATTHFVHTINPSRVALKGKTTERIEGNSGPKPYPGITKSTCSIDESRIKGKDIILIDDIYTPHVNVDEDCIQALLDAGANSIIFYAIAYTRRD